MSNYFEHLTSTTDVRSLCSPLFVFLSVNTITQKVVGGFSLSLGIGGLWTTRVIKFWKVSVRVVIVQ